MIGFSALVCPGCGAALPPDALLSVVTCTYCGASVTCDATSVSAAGFRRALADLDETTAPEARTWIGGLPYRPFAKIGQGEHCDVFFGERARRITEHVVIKMAREPADAARLDDAHDVLSRLYASTSRGATHFTLRLPQIVARATATSDVHAELPAIVWRFASGFVHTLEDVRREHRAGVDARHAVWMWRRILELLGFVHASGFVHGSISPDHLLVHARDHGVMFAGWSDARPLDGTPLEDIVMSARCIAYVLGGEAATGTVPSSVPGPIADLILAVASPSCGSARPDDAWALSCALGDAARSAYGPPTYYPFAMPGWHR